MGPSGHSAVISLVIKSNVFPSGKAENNATPDQPYTTHLVKHSVSKTQQLPEEVEPAVQEGEETQQKEHYTCIRTDRQTERHRETDRQVGL